MKPRLPRVFNRRLSLRDSERLLGIALLLPTVLLIGAVVLYPMISTMWLAFFDENLSRPNVEPQFVGLENFGRLVSDGDFWKVVLNSAVLTAGAVAGEVIIGMVIALSVNASYRGRGLFRTLNILPWVIPSFVTAFVWIWVLHPQFGPLNALLLWLRILPEPIAWLSDGVTAMMSLIAVYVWKGLPWTFLVLLAGLQTIPEHWYEAAKVDGASAWQMFRYITVPALRYIIVIVLVLRTIWTFNSFDMVYLLTGGGPARATLTLPMRVYTAGFREYDIGMSSAIAAVMVLLVVILSLLVLRIGWIEDE
jgi:multiple sugar transport system permease protein